VVANKLASDEIVGVFTNGGAGKILNCVLANNDTLPRVNSFNQIMYLLELHEPLTYYTTLNRLVPPTGKIVIRRL